MLFKTQEDFKGDTIMGYTNYWHQYRDFTDSEWDEITLFYDEHILTDHSSYPRIKNRTTSNDEIVFDGDDGGSCETFVLNKRVPEPRWEDDNVTFNCSKTNGLPYDKVVWKMLKFIKFVVLDPSKADFIIKNDNGMNIVSITDVVNLWEGK